MNMISIFICYVIWDEQNEYHTKVHNISYIYSIFQHVIVAESIIAMNKIYMSIAKTTKSNK